LQARASGEPFAWDDGPGELQLGGRRVLLGRDRALRINFVGPPGTFPVVPFGDVLADARAGRPRPEMKGAVVLIGLTARGQQDYHATPYANHYAGYLCPSVPGLMSGVELQANILATLWDRAYVTTPWWLAPLPWLLVFGAGLGRLFARVNLEVGLLLAVAHHFAWKVFAQAAFTYAHWRVEVVAMLLLGALAYSATFALRWRVLRRMLGVVKSEAVALALEADPHKLNPGGEEREVTVLFADIRRFTDFAERHTPAEVVALLNAYFAAVVPLIEAEGGMLNTYMGDGIMVLFGAPATQADHALRAVRAAVAMVRKVHELRDTWARLDRAGVWRPHGGMRIGVGVHTGKAVVGAIGSPRRLDYTAIGDTVNTAARIEAENKVQETEILVSAETRAAIPDQERAQLPLDADPCAAEVKGKEQKLLLYPVAVP
jgi:adenylate cyclase